MTIPLRAYLIVGAGVALLLGYAGWAAHERSLGALQQRLAVADSVHRVDSTRAALAVVRAAQATAEAGASRQLAVREEARGRRVAQRTDSVVYATATARAAAERVLADSLASLAQVRAELQRLVTQSRADSAQAAAQRAQDAATIRAQLLALVADSTAMTRQSEAIDALTRRAIDAERQRDLVKSLTPGVGSRFAKAVGWAALGAGVYAVVKR